MTEQYVSAYERVLDIFDARREPERVTLAGEAVRSIDR